MNLELSNIRIDGGTQSRACINEHVVTDYAEAIQAGTQFPSVIVYFDGSVYWLADGFHRVQAYQRAGVERVSAEVRQGTQRDAILYSVGANASHGLRRTNEDKRRAVETLLSDAEWSKWSDREIARRCSVSSPMVAGLRPKLTVKVYSEEPDSLAEKVVDEMQGAAKARTYTTKHGTQAVMLTENIGGRSKPDQEPLAIDPERRVLAQLTTDALIDEVIGLRADLADAKSDIHKLKDERDALRARVSELSADDSTTVIRQLQAALTNAKNAQWREAEKTAAAMKQVYALKKELKRIEMTEVPL